MNYLQFVEIVSNISYKKDTRILVFRLSPESPIELIIESDVQDVDSVNPKVIIISHRQVISSLEVDSLTEEQEVVRMIRNAIRSLENHEFDEWFKFKNKHVTIPHF